MPSPRGLQSLRRLLALCLTALLVSVGLAAAESQRSGRASTHTVAIENLQYNPPQLRVHRGDRIVWVNKDLFPHTVTAASHSFDSGSIAANGSWSYVASKAGEYPYGCTFHSTMKGTIQVQ